MLNNVLYWSILWCDWQVHLWDRSSVCVDGAADSEENERDDWMAQWGGRWTLFTWLVYKEQYTQIECVLFCACVGWWKKYSLMCVSLLVRGRHLQHVQCDDRTLQVFPRGQDQGHVCRSSPRPLHIWTRTWPWTHTDTHTHCFRCSNKAGATLHWL